MSEELETTDDLRLDAFREAVEEAEARQAAFAAAAEKWETEVWRDSSGTWHAEASVRIELPDGGYTFRGRSRSGSQSDAIHEAEAEATDGANEFREALGEAVRKAREIEGKPRD